MSVLIQHAKENVWCEPNQDAYHTFKPHRTSSDLGAAGRVQIAWYQVNLPTSYPDRYHTYHIGKIDAGAIGLNLSPGDWENTKDLMQDNRAIIDAYLSNGAILPKEDVFVCIQSDYSVVIAVKIKKLDLGKVRYVESILNRDQNVPYRIDSGQLFIRFYRNMRFSTPSWQAIAKDTINPVRVVQTAVANIANYTSFIGQVSAIRNRFGDQGAGIFYRDGLVENLPDFYNAKYLAKTLSYVYDSSIKSIQFHKLKGLRQFNSKLDVGKSKYIILSTTDYESIDYIDDVDFYVCERDGTNGFRGVFFNRYLKDSMRMVTHNAWSLNVDYINTLINDHRFNTANVEIMVVLRQGALNRGLVHQNNRIEELYRLPRASIINILAGGVASVPEWHASELENSAYCRLMGVRENEITKTLAVEAYGYNAITESIEPVITNVGDLNTSPQIPVGGVFTIADAAGKGARAIFCYDKQRELIGYYGNDDLSNLEIVPADYAVEANLLELFHAKIDELDDGTFYDKDVSGTDLTFWGHRCYVSPMVNGVPTNKWRDVTGGVFYTYSVIDGVPHIKWNWGLLDNANFYPAVRINGVMHVYKATLPNRDEDYDGVIKITVGSQSEQFGSTMMRPMHLAPAVCDIFMDGRLLIRNVDYYLKWPTAVIVRRPKKSIGETEVLVRTYGCCDEDTMLPYAEREVGFVKGGILSVDGEYDIRNDRSVKVNIAGRIYSKDEVRFAENEVGITVTDGLPYIVEDYITPIEPYTGHDTVEQRMMSYALDRKVQAYLTTQLSEVAPSLPTVVFERWRVFSPFLNAIIHEMIFGSSFRDQILNVRYGNIEVENWLQPYRHLLDFDPAYLGFDETYIVVYPHLWQGSVDVTRLQFTFLQYLIRNYLFNRVELSQSVNIRSV